MWLVDNVAAAAPADGGDGAKYPNNANPSSCNFSTFNLMELCCKKKDGSGIDRKGWNCTNVGDVEGDAADVMMDDGSSEEMAEIEEGGGGERTR